MPTWYVISDLRAQAARERRNAWYGRNPQAPISTSKIRKLDADSKTELNKIFHSVEHIQSKEERSAMLVKALTGADITASTAQCIADEYAVVHVNSHR